MPDIANDFYATIIETVEGIISKKNYKLIVSNTKETKLREYEYLKTLTSGIVDGMIIASTMEDFEEYSDLSLSGFPLVFLDRVLPNCPCDTITVNNYNAVYAGVEDLIRSGHKRIAYITGLPRISTTKERLSAYKDAMNYYGLKVEDSFIREGDSMSQSSFSHVEEILKAECTAIVVSNNVMADDVLFSLRTRGLQLGKDIEILAYNESDRVSYSLRDIHTIRQPVKALGTKAGKQILERIKNPNLPIRQTILEATYMP